MDIDQGHDMLSRMSSPDIKVPEGHVPPPCRLTGEDGNAFAIMGRVKDALKGAGCPQETVDLYLEQAMSGCYDHLLAVSMLFVDAE